ncbi:hypothetical protein [Noviherbaspirillum aridicola]|uniref:Uncharacterized protein n=1 Tax=Noviherbaspirillum aridicola TaxID=2849687 RepID=A0ABQ4PZC8_9BURK|nr:hypothetical protein [Noviherbaspirillum aridicola]GIZ50232.1 hypothetical protein NCCP691_02460 [Noviherbaspirillum aridicola]
MHYQDIFALVVLVFIASAFAAWLVFQAGRLNGFRAGLEEGAGRSRKAQHLRGMADGYAMALQHTPAQRDEYMRNVLLKLGTITEADMEADRARRRAREEAMASLSRFD